MPKKRKGSHLTRLARLAADLERWRKMKVVCVNAPDPARAAQVMRLVVNTNLRRLESEPASQVALPQS